MTDQSVSRLTQDQDSDRLILRPRQGHDQTRCTRPLYYYYYLQYNNSHLYGDYTSKGGRCVYFPQCLQGASQMNNDLKEMNKKNFQ